MRLRLLAALALVAGVRGYLLPHVRRGCALPRRARHPAATETGVAERLGEVWDGVRYFANETAEVVQAFSVPKLEDDELPEAVALNAALDAANEAPRGTADWSAIANLTTAYYSASFERIFARPVLKERMGSIFGVFNGVVLVLLLRLLLPRLLAIQNMDDVYAFAPQLGLPSREELVGYVEYTQGMSGATKLGLFFAVMTLEKARDHAIRPTFDGRRPRQGRIHARAPRF